MMIRNIITLGRRKLHTITSRKLIKPSSPTPSHLHSYNLSLLDHYASHAYTPLVLFYPNCSLTADEKARVLKESLSKSLTRYYPFAGRLHTPTTPYIDCNDEGVVFVEAQNDTQMAKFQHISEHDDGTVFGQLFADGMIWHNAPHSTCLVGVQLTHFSCGGMVVAVSLSHKICDGCTIASYVSHWASVARYGYTDHKEVLPFSPHFIQSPATTISLSPETNGPDLGCANNLVTKKFVFPNIKLSELQNKVSTQSINKPTRVEVLASLLYKTKVAATATISGSFQPSILVIPVNMRKKFVPKLPQTAVGNYISLVTVPTKRTSETTLSRLVHEIKKEKMDLDHVQSLLQASQHVQSVMSRLENEYIENAGSRLFWCSSLCGFPFGKVDFGWGKPVGAAVIPVFVDKESSLLSDTPDGDGIEARVALEKEHMEVFQNDKELLSFCRK